METKEIDITDGMRQLYIPRLNMVSKCTEESLRTWLANNDSFVPSSSGLGDSFELVFYDISTFLSCLASDISRLSCASIESLNNINEVYIALRSMVLLQRSHSLELEGMTIIIRAYGIGT